MTEIAARVKWDRQYAALKKICKKLAQHFALPLKDIEDFVLKQEFGRGLLYESHTDLFICDFRQWMEVRMKAAKGDNRPNQLNKRIWGKL